LPFSAFSTLASIVGVDLRYITEEATLGDKLVRIHDGFEIDIPLLKNTMDIYQL
jgi:hypothetical protein